MKRFILTTTAIFILVTRTNGQSDKIKPDHPNYWSRNREYTYNVNYIDSIGNLISNERLTMHPTGEIWEADTRQTLMDFKLDSLSADWNKMPTVPLNGIERNWMTHYHEGVLQNAEKIWIHPLRQNQYILTEIAPFPEVDFPTARNKTWHTTLYIYKPMGTFVGTVESVYTIEKQEERNYNFGKLKCWKVIAIGTHNTLGKSLVIYYFNEEYGFTEMNYSFYNKQILEIKLTNLSK